MGRHPSSGAAQKSLNVHPGWLQTSLPSPRTAPESPETSTSNVDDSFIPTNDPSLAALTDRLQDDFPYASDVTFFVGNADWSGAQDLSSLLQRRGWLLVARHYLESFEVVTEHYVAAGLATDGPLPPELCLHLTTCSFDRSGSIEAPDNIVTCLTQQAKRLNAHHAHQRHQARVISIASRPVQRPKSLESLDQHLDAIETHAAETRKRIATIPFNTAAYQALDQELTRIIREFHATLGERRLFRLQRDKERSTRSDRTNSSAADVQESLEPVVLIRWNLEP